MKNIWGAGLLAVLTASAAGVAFTSQATAQETPATPVQTEGAPKPQAPAVPDKATIGKPFKAFTLRNMNSEKGEMFSTADLNGKKPYVGVFMANRCGTTWTYEQKIGDLIKNYTAKGVQVFAVHSNYQETDDEIKGQFEQRNLDMPLLDDKQNQALAKYVGARVTPTFFVVDKKGVLQYIGAFDRFGRDPYMVPVMDAVLAGKKVPFTQTQAFG